MNPLYKYGQTFFDYQQVGSLASARAVAPTVLSSLAPNSVLDVGCGAGAWLAAYREAGICDVQGIDAGYLDPDQLLFDRSLFRAVDVSRAFDLGRTFSLVQCLEVAEHLPPPSSRTLVGNLTRHGDVVLFSAATPGQGGENHVNERSYEHWRQLFSERGYVVLDPFRPQLAGRPDVECWYRYNLLLFVREGALGCLPANVRATRVPRHEPVPEFAPAKYRLRKWVLSGLPPAAVTRLARAKHRLAVLGRTPPFGRST